ncbi:MAG: hypothetical protein F4X20_06515 [Dehalococcoidia bacterium]|nr:hypothetical protein [Dehalococcoidia bacterium]
MAQILTRLFGAYLLLTAIAVALLLMITPLIHDGSPEYPNWTIMNYFMALGVILMVVLTYLYRWRLDPEQTDNYTCAIVNGLFYGSVVLLMLFFWQYFWLLDTSTETGDAALSHIIYFPLMDALYVVLGLIIGERLLRYGGQQ